jgi:hypothetical protein
MHESSEPLGEYVFRRSAPDIVLSSREVIAHVIGLHEKRCGMPLAAYNVPCPCEPSHVIAIQCSTCAGVVYAIAFRGAWCEHGKRLRSRHIPLQWWPTR